MQSLVQNNVQGKLGNAELPEARTKSHTTKTESVNSKTIAMITFKLIPASAEDKKTKFKITFDPADTADREKLETFEEGIESYFPFVSISGGGNVRTVICPYEQHIEKVKELLEKAKIDPEK